MRPSRLTLLGAGLLALALAGPGCGGGEGGSTTGPTTGPGAFQNASIEASPQAIRPGGSSTITVMARTVSGQPVEGVGVTLSTTAGTLDPTSGPTGPDGMFRARLRTSRTAFVTARVCCNAAGAGLSVTTAVFVR